MLLVVQHHCLRNTISSYPSHLLTYSPTNLLTYSPTRLLTYSPTHLRTCSLVTYLLTTRRSFRSSTALSPRRKPAATSSACPTTTPRRRCAPASPRHSPTQTTADCTRWAGSTRGGNQPAVENTGAACARAEQAPGRGAPPPVATPGRASLAPRQQGLGRA